MRKAPARAIPNHHRKAITPVSLRAGVPSGLDNDNSPSPRCLRLRKGPADRFFDHIKKQSCPSCITFFLALDRAARVSNNLHINLRLHSLATTVQAVCDDLIIKHHNDNKRTKLDWQKAHSIRALHAEGCSQTQLAEIFGVGVNAISKIVRNERWKASSKSVNGQFSQCRPKLDWGKVREIRALYARGELSQEKIGKQFGGRAKYNL